MSLPAFDIQPRFDLGVFLVPSPDVGLAISKHIHDSILASARSWEAIVSLNRQPDHLNQTVQDAINRVELHQRLVHEQFSRSFDALRRQFTEAVRFQIPPSFDEQLERSAAALEPSARQLGALGWTLPLNQPVDFAGLAIQVPEHEMDELFLELYARDDGADFARLINDLRERACLSNHLPLIEECRQSYMDGRYLVVVPALLRLVEPLVLLVGRSQDRRVTVRAITESIHTDSRRYRRVIWASIVGFVQTVFADSDFRNPRPPLINRHWVLHGRGASDWTQADALRLFHALDTLSYAVDADLTPTRVGLGSQEN